MIDTIGFDYTFSIENFEILIDAINGLASLNNKKN